MKNILSLSDLESYFNGKKTFSYNFKGNTKDIWVNKEKSETYVERPKGDCPWRTDAAA